MSEKKTLEAEEHMRLAAKALKTGFLKWSPDYDTAGDEYSRAATAFKVTVILDYTFLCGHAHGHAHGHQRWVFQLNAKSLLKGCLTHVTSKCTILQSEF